MTALAGTRVGATRSRDPDHATSYRGEDWREHAACRNHNDPELWFPDGNGWAAVASYNAAQLICNTCPVQTQCAEAGRNEKHGMWGGTRPEDRGWDPKTGNKKKRKAQT